MKNQDGFATVLLISALPALLAFGAAVLFAFSFLKQDLATLNVCRAVQLNQQAKFAKDLNKLFDLNPKAFRLRMKYEAAELKHIACLVSGNEVCAANEERKMIQVRIEQTALAVKQQVIMGALQVSMATSTSSVGQDVQREWRVHHNPMTSWLEGSLALQTSKAPRLSLQPDSDGIAPEYEPASDFEEAQTWKQGWKVSFRVARVFQHFLHFGGQFERSCATSLYKEGDRWVPKLKNDRPFQAKSWLKDFF